MEDVNAKSIAKLIKAPEETSPPNYNKTERILNQCKMQFENQVRKSATQVQGEFYVFRVNIKVVRHDSINFE